MPAATGASGLDPRGARSESCRASGARRLAPRARSRRWCACQPARSSWARRRARRSKRSRIVRSSPTVTAAARRFFANEMPRQSRAAVELTGSTASRCACGTTSAASRRGCAVRGRGSAGTQRFDLPDYPVSRVTWNDAQTYCSFSRRTASDRSGVRAEQRAAPRGGGIRGAICGTPGRAITAASAGM